LELNIKTNTRDLGYFLYHFVDIFPYKEHEMANATAEFGEVWSAANDKKLICMAAQAHDCNAEVIYERGYR
tara:strand:- start:34 stop:246 length:213 start_codon:yes stop_codon:yes gene_type:complete